MQDGTRLRLQVISSADGMRGPNYLFTDSQLIEDCFFRPAGDGVQRCMPEKTTPLSDYFGDDRCTQPIYETSAATGPEYDYAYALDAKGCESSSYYRIGAESVGTTYQSIPSCSVQSPVRAYYNLTSFAVTGFQDGVASAATSYPWFRSGTRIAFDAITANDGARMVSRLFDMDLGVECDFRVARDGQLRCLPEATASIGMYYSDPNCGHPLASSPCGSPRFAQTRSCPPTFYRLTPYQGLVYTLVGPNCYGQQFPPPPPPPPLYQLGPEVQPSELVAGTLSGDH